MSPKTTPKAERPSAGRLPEIAGRAVALTELDMRDGLLTRHLSVPDMLLVIRGVNVHVDRKRCSVASPEPRRVSIRPGGSTVRSRMAHLGQLLPNHDPAMTGRIAPEADRGHSTSRRRLLGVHPVRLKLSRRQADDRLLRLQFTIIIALGNLGPCRGQSYVPVFGLLLPDR